MPNCRPLLLLLLLAAAGAVSADWMTQLKQSMSSLPKELAAQLQEDAAQLERKLHSAVGQLSHRPSLFEIADRPTGHGRRPSPFEIADRPTGHGRRPSPFEIADRPTGHGRRPSPFEIADHSTGHGHQTSPPFKIISRPSIYRHVIHENIFTAQVCSRGARACSLHFKRAFYCLLGLGCLVAAVVLAFVITAVVAAARRRRQRAAVVSSSSGRRLLGSGLSVQCDPVMAGVYGQKIQKAPV